MVRSKTMKTKPAKPIKTSVFLPREVHQAAEQRAKRRKLSTSAWIARLVLNRLGMDLDNGAQPTYY